MQSTATTQLITNTQPFLQFEHCLYFSRLILCRSLRQLRKEVAAKLAKAAAVKVKADNSPVAPMPVPAGLNEYESHSDTGMSPDPVTDSHQYIKV